MEKFSSAQPIMARSQGSEWYQLLEETRGSTASLDLSVSVGLCLFLNSHTFCS